MPTLLSIKRKLKQHFKASIFEKYLKKIKNIFYNTKQENDALYRLIYHYVHDKEQSLSLAGLQTQNAFAFQWENLRQGQALLAEPWFKDNVSRILCEEELQIRSQWFQGKNILDAGCGNGRWSYGFSQLGANVTAVDINQVALDKTREALQEFPTHKNFILSPLEQLTKNLGSKQFDLVFSWGVVHHCESFNRALDQLTQCVKEGGMIYLYLYGRESLSLKEDLKLFKERVIYNTLFTDEERQRFLLKKADGDISKVHICHDFYAPLINRRLEFDDVKNFLEQRDFQQVERTIHHTELFLRAFKGDAQGMQKEILPKKNKPYWFERYSL